MTVAVANFIEALLVHYPVKHDNEEREDAWVDSMIAALKQYPASVLQEVAQHIIRHRKYRNFPLLSEVMDACDNVEAKREAEKRRATLPAFRPPVTDLPGDWEVFANTLLKTPLGRQAAKEGWVRSYWDFCRNNRRAPAAAHEIERCKRETREFDQTYQALLRGDVNVDPSARPMLLKIADSMLSKRQELAEIANGRGA